MISSEIQENSFKNVHTIIVSQDAHTEAATSCVGDNIAQSLSNFELR